MGCKSSTVFDSLFVLSPARTTILYVSFTTAINEKYVNTLSTMFQKKNVHIPLFLYTCLDWLLTLLYFTTVKLGDKEHFGHPKIVP